MSTKNNEQKEEELMPTWVMKKRPELIPVVIDPKIYNQKILEIAEALYKYLSGQLTQSLVPIPIGSVPQTDRGERRAHE